ncbi:MAG: hypothetical protein MUC73_05470 [Cyclobacteriaceae bacterium]|nr:hypothetical protein [Cyclobacteriaceae bacterium]
MSFKRSDGKDIVQAGIMETENSLYRILTYLLTSTLFIHVVLLAHVSHAQQDLMNTVRANNLAYRLNNMGGMLKSGDVITGLPSSFTSEVVGDVYWDKHWGKSSILMENRTEPVEGYLTRYDIQKNEFEFLLESNVRVLSGSKIVDMIWIDSLSGKTRYLVNAGKYKENGVPLTGFMELLSEGDQSLFKVIRIEILKPDFNPALNVGSKDTRIIKKESFYFATGNDLVQIKSKKSVEPILQSKGGAVESYLKREAIKFTREADLVKFFNFVNSLQ